MQQDIIQRLERIEAAIIAPPKEIPEHKASGRIHRCQPTDPGPLAHEC